MVMDSLIMIINNVMKESDGRPFSYKAPPETKGACVQHHRQGGCWGSEVVEFPTSPQSPWFRF